MSSNEHIERISDEPAITVNHARTHSRATSQNNQGRTGNTTWCRFRSMFTRSRSMEPSDRCTAERRSSKRKSGRCNTVNDTGNSSRRRFSWKSMRERFRRLSTRNHRSASNISVESNITIDIDGHRREDSPVLPRQNVNMCHSEAGSSGSHESTSGCLFLKSPLKDRECCIPRMIHRVINCSWYWGNIDRFDAAVVRQFEMNI